MSSESKDDVNEEEVHQLFNLIDTERTGYITPTVRFKQKIYKLIIWPFSKRRRLESWSEKDLAWMRWVFFAKLEFPAQWAVNGEKVYCVKFQFEIFFNVIENFMLILIFLSIDDKYWINCRLTNGSTQQISTRMVLSPTMSSKQAFRIQLVNF